MSRTFQRELAEQFIAQLKDCRLTLIGSLAGIPFASTLEDGLKGLAEGDTIGIADVRCSAFVAERADAAAPADYDQEYEVTVMLLRKYGSGAVSVVAAQQELINELVTAFDATAEDLVIKGRSLLIEHGAVIKRVKRTGLDFPLSDLQPDLTRVLHVAITGQIRVSE
jgi:hypothetical protein